MIPTKDLPPPADRYPVRRALLSVSDTAGVDAFAQRLAALGVELVSTGGTARRLRDAGLAVQDVSALTGSPELLDGRVKTLHPKVHAGLLARRTDPEDLAQLEEHGIAPIDLVVVNLYPFGEAVAQAGVTDAEAAENVDIGGPTMVRAAAKNFFFVGVVTSPDQYDAVADELERNDGQLSLATRRRLAHAAFAHTAAYDAAIADYFAQGGGTAAEPEALPESFAVSLPKAQALRYGENPHQQAALYGHPEQHFEQLHGKALSFNNLLDLTAALDLIREFRDHGPTAAILKHTNPCGVGTAETLAGAYARAFATDRQSPFGGIVVVNRPLDRATAEAIDEIFTELILAPDFEEGVLDLLQQKKNRRLIRLLDGEDGAALDVRTAAGGLLVQEQDPPLGPLDALRERCTVATKRAPTEAEWRDLDFAWRVAKHVKSNAIVYARDGATLGIGAGQMSRVDASEVAVMKGGKEGHDFAGSALASDAFFPFADGLLAAAAAGATAVIQPGGSIRDDEVVQAADEHDLAMVFTGHRHFRH
ncbi:MAG: bifunctional phosphoribosylaminoimidazolecarboxamide formyltransferase/IMP cyclohydrolase [Rhodothermales bacterium]|nr:bifunctional phosphoribosylaminoimidazolecarboxamide formyltransferase/IMP cyclohydrolase [Rhodothermales bacterium]